MFVHFQLEKLILCSGMHITIMDGWIHKQTIIAYTMFVSGHVMHELGMFSFNLLRVTHLRWKIEGKLALHRPRHDLNQTVSFTVHFWMENLKRHDQNFSRVLNHLSVSWSLKPCLACWMLLFNKSISLCLCNIIHPSLSISFLFWALIEVTICLSYMFLSLGYIWSSLYIPICKRWCWVML